jgi:very-short-patch-repair endonuclease
MAKVDRAYLVERYEAGDSIERIATAIGVTYAAVRQRLLKAGVTMRDNRREADAAIERATGLPIAEVTEQMVNLYRDGNSLVSVGKRFGMTKPAVVKRLRERGVEIRTLAESSQLRFARMGEEERRSLTEPAHVAVRGQPRGFEAKCRAAETREGQQKIGSVLEAEMVEMLRERGVSPRIQVAVGPYNIDLAIEETSIAVELFGGQWHNFGANAESYPERIKYLIDAGWHVVVIWVTRFAPLSRGATDYVIALHESVRRGESAVRQEWVIRGNGNLKPICKSDPRHRAIVHRS